MHGDEWRLVRGVMARSMSFGSMLAVAGSISTRTGRGAAIGDGFRGGKKCVRRGDDFAAGLHAERQKAEMQRGGAAGERDAVLDAAEIGELALECGDFRAFHEGGGLAYVIERL